jgi:hypothetical protein
MTVNAKPAAPWQEAFSPALAKPGTKRLEGRTLRAGTSFIPRKNGKSTL